MSSAGTTLFGTLNAQRVTALLGCTAGLLGFFILYGILQERIMTKPYGSVDGHEEMFTFSAFLVLNNRLVSAIGALVILLYKGESIVNVAPIHKYGFVSLSNVVSTYCQYEALRYVSFPTQTLGKCAKMFPVMVVGTILSGKRYTLKDYVSTAVITLGCVMFLMTGESKAPQLEQADTPLGLTLMLGYLFFDGFTSTFQDHLFKAYSMSTYNQMLYVNLCSALLSILTLLSLGQLGPSIEFVTKHPALLFDASLLSACSLFGQMVIYYTIKEFGALIFSTIMTTRQMVSIILSCVFYFHPLTLFQWAAGGIVFATLYYSAFGKRSSGHGHSHGSGTTPAGPSAASGTSGDKDPGGGLPITLPSAGRAEDPMEVVVDHSPRDKKLDE